MTQFWTIAALGNGAILAPCFATPGASSHPKDNGWAWDSATQKAVAIAAQPDLSLQSWSGAAWVEDPAKVEAALIAQVKAANEALVKGAYSQNYGKQKKYSRKQQEVMDFRALTPAIGAVGDALSLALTVFTGTYTALATSTKKKKFRFAMAQAALRGVTIDVIIGEFETAIDTNETKVANWEAAELEGVRAIRAAPTAATKRAAYAAINWNWTAS